MIRPLNDVAFHYVFGRKVRQHNLIHLLNAILAKTEAVPIRELVFGETTFTPEILGLKSCRLDLRAKTDLGRQIAVEVQILNLGNMERRSLYYWSKLYNDQLKAGEDYGKLNKAIAINLLDFPFQKAKKARTVCQLVDLETREIISDLLEIHFLSLPLLSPGTADLSCALTRWLLFLNHRTDQSVREEITLLDAEINQASKDLEQLKSDEEARRFYELREKALLDERSLKAFAREEGEAKGLAKGREESKIEVARKLLEKDMTEEFIQEITGLGVETLRNLKTKLDQN